MRGSDNVRASCTDSKPQAYVDRRSGPHRATNRRGVRVSPRASDSSVGSFLGVLARSSSTSTLGGRSVGEFSDGTKSPLSVSRPGPPDARRGEVPPPVAAPSAGGFVRIDLLGGGPARDDRPARARRPSAVPTARSAKHAAVRTGLTIRGQVLTVWGPNAGADLAVRTTVQVLHPFCAERCELLAAHRTHVTASPAPPSLLASLPPRTRQRSVSRPPPSHPPTIRVPHRMPDARPSCAFVGDRDSSRL